MDLCLRIDVMIKFYSRRMLRLQVFVFAFIFSSLALLAQDGSLDASFDPGAGANSTVETTKIQPDGKILIGGIFSAFNGSAVGGIIRLNSDGSVDNSFQTGTGANEIVRAIAVRPNGKIIIAGNFTEYNGIAVNRIAQLNADGSLDTSFSIGTGFTGEVWTLELAPDGSLFVGGLFSSYNGDGGANLVKLSESGLKDWSFAVGTGTNNVVFAAKLLDDGKVLIGGNFTSYNGTSVPRLMRLNSNGLLDVTFNIGSGPNSFVRAIDVQSDAKILIAGSFTSVNNEPRTRIARLEANGVVDTGFALPATSTQIISVTDILQQADGQVLFSGSFSGYILRLNSDGSYDTSFQSNVGGNVYSISIQSDGKLVIGGQFQFIDLVNRNYIGRLNNTAGNPPVVCNAGSIPTGTTSLCASAYFTFDVVGSDIPEGYLYGLLFQPGVGASGGFGEASYITDVPLSLSFNGDLNGLFSGSGYPPLSGPWTITGVVYSDPNDIAGSTCATSNSVVVDYLDCDCQGLEGGNAFIDGCGTCVGGTTGLEACDASCWTPTVAMQSPNSITYAYSNAVGWSVPVGYHDNIEAQAVVYVDSIDGSALGCNSTSNDLTGKVALIQRGSCTFSQKVYNAQQAGAIAVIVVNNVIGNDTFEMGAGQYAELITIPVVMIGNTDGLALIASAQNGPVGLFIGNTSDCPIYGCTNIGAANYNTLANIDDGSCYFNVVFRVDMSEVTDPFITPEVNGTFNGWCGGCQPMTNIGGSVWELIIPLAPGNYEFKYAADAWNIQEELTPGDFCTLTTDVFTNRTIQVVDQSLDLGTVCWASCSVCDSQGVFYDVVFRVDMSQVSDSFTTPEVNGTFNGWCGGCSPMTNVGGDLWEATISLAPGFYEFKYAADAWNIQEELTPGDTCTLSTGTFTNRVVEVVDTYIILDLVCWGACSSCVQPSEGCTYPLALNYNGNVAVDDGSCLFAGCMNPLALNYTPLATSDDGSCLFDSGSSCEGDINGDGVVNSGDLLSFLSAFGTTCQ